MPRHWSKIAEGRAHASTVVDYRSTTASGLSGQRRERTDLGEGNEARGDYGEESDVFESFHAAPWRQGVQHGAWRLEGKTANTAEELWKPVSQCHSRTADKAVGGARTCASIRRH